MNKLLNAIRYLLPSPFTIGILLTLLTFLLALLAKPSDQVSYWVYSGKLLDYWNTGFWELLQFAMQMVLMLLLGHVIAISKPADVLISKITGLVHNGAAAAFYICFFTILVSLFNWGLGLIFGAIIARKMGEKMQLEGKRMNYPLLGAAGYCGLMVWHGGLSGSAPLKVADPDHFLVDRIGVIPMQETVFSNMNIVASVLLLLVIPMVFYFIGKRDYHTSGKLNLIHRTVDLEEERPYGAEKLDYQNLPGWVIGGIVVIFSVSVLVRSIVGGQGMSFINTNYINLFLFGLAILVHGRFKSFLDASGTAVQGTLGIIIQFPVYAGIMGIMKYSGLTGEISEMFIAISGERSLPVFTFMSSGLVNIFVPSGGGQWAVQGEIVVNSAQELGVSVPKNIMALAYGDQLTNMLQPFWALPLLGITGLKAKDIFPYTFLLFGLGTIIFLTVLILF